MKKLLVVSMFAITSFGYAQSGFIAGKITDKETNNDPLPFANVLIKGTAKGTQTDFDGLFQIENLEAGTYTLAISFVGYETLEVPDLVVKEGKVTQLNTGLGAGAVALDEVILSAPIAKKDSEIALLLEQKKAVIMKTSIGAQELSRKGIGDVAEAVGKTTGISKQEGSGNIYVRGLGDRYNSTTFNGLPLPSNNPSRKNIELGLFSTDIVASIGIDKIYVYSNYGDFAGANIDIVSKDYRGDGLLELEIGTGGNTEAISLDKFYLQDGPNYSGLYDTQIPVFALNNYNFDTSLDREVAPTPVNGSFSLKGGKSFTLGEETRLSIFGVGSFGNGYTFKEGISRGNVTTGGIIRKDYDYDAYEYDTNTTLMGNVSLSHKGHTLNYNTLYVNSTNQKQQEFFGVVDAFDYAPNGGAFVQRSTFERTQLLVHQLLGKHNFTPKFEVNWGVSYNNIQNVVPDRRQVTLTPDDWDVPEGPKSFRETLNDADNHRFYHDLFEDEIATNLSATFKFNENPEDDTFKGKLTLGYNGRFKIVEFDATQINYEIIKRNSSGGFLTQPIVEDIYNLDAYFNQTNLDAGLFKLRTFRGGVDLPTALDPQTYDGDQNIHAGYLALEYKFSDALSIVAAIRGEQIEQSISWSTALDPEGDTVTLDELEILPSLSLKYSLNDKQNLKFAASKTYTLPQFKERAPFQYEEVTQVFFGNPALYPSTDYNVDLKWEFFPTSAELLSVTAYGKIIQNPINEITINSATNDISYVNSGEEAKVLGAEIEIRKNLFKKEKEQDDNTLIQSLSLGANISYLYSTQDLDGDKVLRETTEVGVLPLSVDFSNTESELTGASNLLLNGDISFFNEFKKDKSLLATLSCNYFSDRVYSLGTEGRGNLVDRGFHTIDFILKAQINKNIGLGLSAENLLNPTVKREQELPDVTVLTYKKGTNLGLSLKYTF